MKLKTVLIGLGRIGWSLELDSKRYHPCTHAGTLKYLSEYFDLIGVCDRNPKKIYDFFNWWNSNLISDTDYKNLLLKLKKVDFVIVATGVDSHLEILNFLINLKVRLILVEKPISYSTKELKPIFTKKTNLIYINFERRYHPYYKKVKQIIERKIFGELITIYGRVFSKTRKNDPLLEDGIHLLDLILWYLGIPEILNSYWEFANSQEKRSYHILKKDNILIFLESGGSRDYFEFHLTFDFTKGRVEIGNDGCTIYRVSVSKKYERFFELKPLKNQLVWENPWINLYTSIYKEEEDNFLDAFYGIYLYENLRKAKTNF
ncbi:MAG: Gfo/Idh/MocA family protein [Leptonema sp. (in: bacteria)]